MSYKLVAIDLDDTLLNDDLEISPANREAIEMAVEQGVVVILSTGRMFCSAQRIAQSLHLNFPLLSYNGALIKNTLDGKVLYSNYLPFSLAKNILEFLEPQGYDLNCYVDDKLYVKEISPRIREYINVANVSAEAVGNLTSFLKTEPIKLLVLDEEKVLDRLAETLKRIYGEKITLAKSKPHYLDIVNKGVSKGIALKQICQSFGFSPQEVIAIGDSYNDVDMIRFAGLGVIMGNARDELKKIADYVAPPNSEDGVAHVLKKFVLE